MTPAREALAFEFIELAGDMFDRAGFTYEEITLAFLNVAWGMCHHGGLDFIQTCHSVDVARSSMNLHLQEPSQSKPS